MQVKRNSILQPFSYTTEQKICNNGKLATKAEEEINQLAELQQSLVFVEISHIGIPK